MNRFERILNSPAPEIPAAEPRAVVNTAPSPARSRVVNEIVNKIENITLDKDTQEKYWKAVLSNAYFLRYPAKDAAGYRRFIPMRSLYEVLERLQQGGAGLARIDEQPRPGTLGLRRPGKISRLKLEQGGVPQMEWNRIRTDELPKYKDQLRWLFTLSAMGAAAEYVDLKAELPAEWVGDVLGKHGERIAEIREEIIAEMAGKGSRLCFEVEDDNAATDGGGMPVGKIYCLVPGKTGRRMAGGRAVTELTPEEAVLIAEAQAAGLLPGGTEGARSALKWAG